MLSSPEQSSTLRPQRVSFCCVRHRPVNHQHKDCLRLEVFLTSKAGQGSGTFPVQGTRRLTPRPHCQNRSNTLLFGNEATETAFKKSVNHRIIHLAVHA